MKERRRKKHKLYAYAIMPRGTRIQDGYIPADISFKLKQARQLRDEMFLVPAQARDEYEIVKVEVKQINL